MNSQADKQAGRAAQDNKSFMQGLQFVSQSPEHGTKGETHRQRQHNASSIVLWHAPVGGHVLSKDGPKLCHEGLGILGIKLELLAALCWGAVVCQQAGIVPVPFRKLVVCCLCRAHLS